MTYVERCLYEYPQNVSTIVTSRVDIETLRSVRGHSYDAHILNGISDPVADVTARILSLEKKIMKLRKRTRPVE